MQQNSERVLFVAEIKERKPRSRPRFKKIQLRDDDCKLINPELELAFKNVSSFNKSRYDSLFWKLIFKESLTRKGHFGNFFPKMVFFCLFRDLYKILPKMRRVTPPYFFVADLSISFLRK